MTDSCIKILNEFLAADPEACNALLKYRVKCNQAMVEHPTLVCTDETQPRISFIGVLNGILAQAGQQKVAICLDENKLVGFMKYQPKV